MKIVRIALFAVAVSMVVGYTTSGRRAHATVPNPCPMYQCKQVTYWWTGSKTQINASFAVGGKATTTTAFADIFTPTSSWDGPPKGNGNYDEYTYPECSPHCGKDSNGVWQALQEVSPAGPRSLNPIATNVVRFDCENPTSVAKTVASAPNANVDKNTPPGN